MSLTNFSAGQMTQMIRVQETRVFWKKNRTLQIAKENK